MRKIYQIILVIVLLLLGGLTIFYFFQSRYGCEFGESTNCNTKCKVDSDCKFELGQCVNVKENVRLRRNIMPAYLELDCKCENNECVGTPTGRIIL